MKFIHISVSLRPRDESYADHVKILEADGDAWEALLEKSGHKQGRLRLAAYAANRGLYAASTVCRTTVGQDWPITPLLL